MTDEMPDPIARSIYNLLDHMHAVDAKIERMSCALGELGHKECTGELPELKNALDAELDVVVEAAPEIEVEQVNASK